MNTKSKFIAASILAALLVPSAWAGGTGTTAPAGNDSKPTSTGQKDAPSQTPEAPVVVQVTVSSKGQDVRDVLATVFEQKKASFVISPGIHYALWLSLNSVDFDEALGIICHSADLVAKQNDGIWYISKAAAKPASPAKPVVPAKPPVTQNDLKKIVSTRLFKAPILQVFSKLSEESKVPIKVDSNVPAYKLDAILNKTSLEYALKTITNAAHLAYKLDGDHILIYQPESVVVLSK